MKIKIQFRSAFILLSCLLAFGCNTFSGPGAVATAIETPTALIDTALPITTSASSTSVPDTATAAPIATQPATATTAPTPTELPIETSLAYVQNDTLMLTHIIGGQPVDTREFIKSDMRGGILSVGWSPSGEYLTFSMFSQSFTHLFVVNVLTDGVPIDLGIANDWAWSPDSKMLAFEHEYELWVYTPATGQSRGLTTHLSTDWLWYKPVFTPDSSALVAALTDSNNMDRNGNTLYKLYQVPLDGSAANAYPPGNLVSITDELSGRMPLDLKFSPDGQKLAMIQSEFFTTCAILSSYTVSNVDASNFQAFTLPSLASFGGPDEKRYFFGDSFVWTPESDGLWVTALVRDCGPTFDVVGGPQISRITLDGQEHEIIPGAYGHLSLDSTGNLLGVENLTALPRVQILGRDGHLVLDLGEGSLPAFQP